jgi:hypothetical protein
MKQHNNDRLYSNDHFVYIHSWQLLALCFILWMTPVVAEKVDFSFSLL